MRGLGPLGLIIGRDSPQLAGRDDLPWGMTAINVIEQRKRSHMSRSFGLPTVRFLCCDGLPGTTGPGVSGVSSRPRKLQKSR